MKKLIPLLLIPLIISSCHDEKDESEIGYISVTAKYNSGTKGPEGDVFMFDLDEHFVEDYTVYVAGDFTYLLDVNGETVFASYKSKLMVKKDPDSGKYINLSKTSLFPMKGIDSSRKFLIAIDLSSSPFSYTTKVINWNNDVVELEKTFSSTSDILGRHFEQW